MKNNLKFPRVPYAMTVHDSKEITAVVNTLKTSTQMGAKTKEFEKKIAHLYSKKIGLGLLFLRIIFFKLQGLLINLYPL